MKHDRRSGFGHFLVPPVYDSKRDKLLQLKGGAKTANVFSTPLADDGRQWQGRYGACRSVQVEMRL